MADALTSACNLVDSLAALQLDVLTRLNKKFAALQNLADLLVQLANAEAWIPNLTGLIPVADINVDLYNAMSAACPYLSLPPATSQLQALQAAVTLAYTNLFQKIARSPHFRLGAVQAEMYKFQTTLNTGLSDASTFLRCLQAVCAAGESVVSGLTAMSDADISKQISTFANNYAAKAGNVLSPEGQDRFQTAQDAMAQLSDLGASTKQDYADAKAALAAKTS
jgi:hypothetical protein